MELREFLLSLAVALMGVCLFVDGIAIRNIKKRLDEVENKLHNAYRRHYESGEHFNRFDD